MEISDAVVKAFIDAIPKDVYVGYFGDEHIIDGMFNVRKALEAAFAEAFGNEMATRLDRACAMQLSEKPDASLVATRNDSLKEA